ncbi:hypothetical protein DRO35_04085 [Candidatus Bathyarchaeota archaeon]|nr:MAG: hypothetical protein DRO35_04085 [Candidatus Bathyarchaeota archaeon]
MRLIFIRYRLWFRSKDCWFGVDELLRDYKSIKGSLSACRHLKGVSNLRKLVAGIGGIQCAVRSFYAFYSYRLLDITKSEASKLFKLNVRGDRL